MDEFSKSFKVHIFKELEKVETYTKLALQTKDYNYTALKCEKETIELEKIYLIKRNKQFESERN